MHCPSKLTSASQLTKNLLKKKELLKNRDPDHGKIKTALIIDGGLMLGVYGGGVVVGLEEMEMTDVFDYVLGVSAGACNGAYFLAGQSVLGTSIYYEDLIDKRFINLLRPAKMVDIDYLELVFREKKPLNTERVRASRSKFLIVATNVGTGKGQFIDAHDLSIDIITALKASTAMPIFYNKAVAINGVEYGDGGIALPLPIEHATTKLGCTDIVVVTNKSCDYRGRTLPTWFEKLLARIYMRKFSSAYQKAFFEKFHHHDRGIDVLWGDIIIDPVVNLGLLCSDELPINRFSQDGKKLQATAQIAREEVLKIFNT